MSYSDISIEITKELSKEIKKQDGIFFTPIETINRNIEFLKPYFSSINTILEPSCGSCEYINKINQLYPTKNITGIEYNKEVYNKIIPLENDKVKLINDNYINYDKLNKYDLIIGNPPYYVMKKNEVDKSFYPYFTGRPNIFILFIIKSLELLNDNGILSFVLPKNFLNCIYYADTRKYITDNYNIVTIMECDDKYIDTQQETVILIIQKTHNHNNSDFVLYNNPYAIFGIPSNVLKLQTLYEESTTLNELNFKVLVGNVVWNQCKNILSNDNTKTRLIYSSDISNGNLELKEYKNDSKKNYIDKPGISHPLLLVNRGYGKGNYTFNYLLIEGGFNYVVENHLICIQYTKNIDHHDLIELYKKVINSFKDPRTTEFINLYFSNNAINTSELNYILPIYW
tara:strand:+ start:336 stop:1532 length:1197 start_codon:yes stop_codon:yes gene_type:complete